MHSASGPVARVDDTDGRLLGTIDREHGFMAFMENLHECGFTCEGESGYVGFLNKPAQIGGLDLTLGNEGTWGTVILAVSALVLLVLVITGLWIWWPRKGASVARCGCGAAPAVTSSTTTFTRSSASSPFRRCSCGR